ncbi:MAG: NUDIX domain-containing protein [Eubacterium sp.]|nr:NUDIX domain-containing protein [Eubacterium sp.]
MSNTEMLTEICIQFRRTADLIEKFVSQTKKTVNTDEAEGGVFFQGELSDTAKSIEADGGAGSVGVIVVNDGHILTGMRTGDSGLICGPGGHIERGETPEQAAIRETQEEFGITPKELIPIGSGPVESGTNLSPHIFLCTEYKGEIKCEDGEISNPRFLSHKEIDNLGDILFKPFADGVLLLSSALVADEINYDGGAGSGNHNHEGVPGQVGGSAPSARAEKIIQSL